MPATDSDFRSQFRPAYPGRVYACWTITLRLDERLHREDLTRVGSRGRVGVAAVVIQDMIQVRIES